MGAIFTTRGAQPDGVHLAVMPRLSNNELFFVCRVLIKAAKVPPMSSHFRSLGSMAYPLVQGPSDESVYLYPRLLNAHNVSHSTLLRHSCEATPRQEWSLNRKLPHSVMALIPLGYHQSRESKFQC